MKPKILRSAQDFGCGLPFARPAGSLTPASRLKIEWRSFFATLTFGVKGEK